MTIEEMKRAKRDLGLSNETLSRLSGVPFSTVQKFFSGKTLHFRKKCDTLHHDNLIMGVAKFVAAPERAPVEGEVQ